jgi:hypothetical protein
LKFQIVEVIIPDRVLPKLEEIEGPLLSEVNRRVRLPPHCAPPRGKYFPDRPGDKETLKTLNADWDEAKTACMS